MRRFVILIGLTLAIMLGITACGKTEATPTAAADVTAPATAIPTPVEPALPDGQFLAFLVRSQQDSFWQAARLGVATKMQELGIKIEYLGTEVENADAQTLIMSNLISRHPVAIAVSPVDADKMAPLIDKAIDAGIKVITINRDAPNSKRALYIGTDNALAGYQIGKQFAEAIGGKGEIAIFHGSLRSPVDVERVDGFNKAIAEYPEIKVDAVIETILPPDATVAALTPDIVLQQYPNLVGIFSVTGASAGASAQALKDVGKCEVVKVFSFGASQQAVDLMREGCLAMFITEKPYTLATQAVDALMGLVNGNSNFPPTTDLGVVVVTPATLDIFLNSNN